MMMISRKPLLFLLLIIGTVTCSSSSSHHRDDDDDNIVIQQHLNNDDCDLTCHHDGVCVIGGEADDDFLDHSTPQSNHGDVLDFFLVASSSSSSQNNNNMHCVCHPGYTGLQCENKYEDCADYNHKCYNGGKCILGLSDVYGNDQLFCDCSEATDKHGVKYVGKYCEIPKTVTCGDNDELFCVHGGWCKSSDVLHNNNNHHHQPASSSSSSLCHCGPHHVGPHCEFEKGAVPECTLSCQNGGECRLGIPKNIPEEEFLYDYWKKHMNYQYCQCPEPYFGTFCENNERDNNDGTNNMLLCGDEEDDDDDDDHHYCFHGGECVTVTEGNHQEQKHYYCDCNRAHDATNKNNNASSSYHYGGEFCQYAIPLNGLEEKKKETSLLDDDDDDDVHSLPSSSVSFEVFVAILTGTVVLTICVTILFMRRRDHSCKLWNIVEATTRTSITMRHDTSQKQEQEEEEEELVLPKDYYNYYSSGNGSSRSSRHCYSRDALMADPNDTSFIIDVPNMGDDRIRPTSPYHEIVFENVEIL